MSNDRLGETVLRCRDWIGDISPPAVMFRCIGIRRECPSVSRRLRRSEFLRRKPRPIVSANDRFGEIRGVCESSAPKTRRPAAPFRARTRCTCMSLLRPAQRTCIAPTSNGCFQQDMQLLRTGHRHLLVPGEHCEAPKNQSLSVHRNARDTVRNHAIET